MTPHYALRGLRPLTQSLRCIARAARPASSSCVGPGKNPGDGACPACVPPPRPACRARPPAALRATRVTCCAPRAARRPPCPPCPPASPRTCSDASPQMEASCQVSPAPLSCDVSANHIAQGGRSTDRRPRPQPCGTERDRVARRKEEADLARRRQYEHEVACREKPVLAVPCAPFRPGGERECARATDGRDYSVPCERPTSRMRCTSDRSPPPPRCVEVAPDSACRALPAAPLDPCAHRPRVIIEIDRSAQAAPAPPTAQTPNTPSPSRTGGLASRILNTLGRARGTHEKRTPAKSSREASRCDRVTSAKTPSSCRRPSIIETLRARAPTPCADPRRGRRGVHTTAAISSVESTTPTALTQKDDDGLARVLRDRELLPEVGRGRSVPGAQSRPPPAPEPAGARLELRVPHGAERVSVRVSLEGAGGQLAKSDRRSDSAPSLASPVAPGGCDLASKIEKRDSWLSLKNIQKKLSSRGRRSEIPRSGTKRDVLEPSEPSPRRQPCAEPPKSVPRCPSKPSEPSKCPPVQKPCTSPTRPLASKQTLDPKCPPVKDPTSPPEASSSRAGEPKKPSLTRCWTPLVLGGTLGP